MKMDNEMEAYLGNVIRYNRIKQKKTQHELSQGICSISHLSKIEKGVYLPNEETLNLLFYRLGKKLDVEQNIHEKLIKRMDDFYYDWTYSDINQLQLTILEMRKEKQHLIFSDRINQYLLFNIAYAILSGETKGLQKEMNDFENLELLSIREQSFFVLLKTTFLNQYGSSKEAIKYIEENGLKILKEDIAEFEYQKGLIFSYHINPALSLIYMGKALASFSTDTNFTKVAMCKSVLAINYERLNLFEEAESEYIDVLRITKKLDDQKLYYETTYNYGLYLKNQKKFTEALVQFVKCKDYFDSNKLHNYLLNLVMWETRLELNNLDEESKDLLSQEMNRIAKLIEIKEKYLVYAQLLELKSIGKMKEYYQLLEKKYIPLLKKDKSFIELKLKYKELIENYQFNKKKYHSLIEKFYLNEIEMEMFGR